MDVAVSFGELLQGRHSKEPLFFASSSTSLSRKLKVIGREHFRHFGHGLNIPHPALIMTAYKDCFIEAGPHFRMNARS